MNIRITAPLSGGIIDAIASKSHVHRLLICAALCDAPTEIMCPSLSEDIEATAACLRALGAQIKYCDGAFSVTPIETVCRNSILPCRESGSTLRFLLPVAAALGAECQFHMEGRLPKRPQQPLLEALCEHGCSASYLGDQNIAVGGQLHSGIFSLPGNLSSQFVSGLLLAFPLLKAGGRVRLQGKLESAPYVHLTVNTLADFGVWVREDADGFSVAAGSTLRTKGKISAEGDWSNAAFWLCAGALSAQPVTCRRLNGNSAQGDRKILSILERMGARVQHTGDEVLTQRALLRGTDIDACDIPDLVPALAAVCALAEGKSRIYNAGRLRLKESDRLRSICTTLCALGADVFEQADGLIISGKPELQGGTACAQGDHRIAMMAAIAAIGCRGQVTVLQAESTNKSYPDFWSHYQALGGKTEVL